MMTGLLRYEFYKNTVEIQEKYDIINPRDLVKNKITEILFCYAIAFINPYTVYFLA